MDNSFLFFEKMPDGTAAVTGAPEGRRRIIVPETLGGMKVSSVAPHALADRDDIREIVLPDSVRAVGNYAFYHCGNLGRLALSDSVDDYGDGAVRVCRNLSLLDITMKRGRWRLIKEILADTDAELYFRLHAADGEAALLFPRYYNEFREDPWARAIYQSIVGAGYAYRQCVTGAGIDYRQYDACFMRIAQVDELAGGRIALMRLMFPYRLEKKAELQYGDYLKTAAGELVPFLTERGDAEGIRFLVKNADIPRGILEEGAGMASDRGLTEICGIFMDAVGRNTACGMETFSLDGL